MVTLKEIANRCEVSVSTVSNILNGKPKVGEETKQRVLEVVKEMGYQPNYFARGLRKQKTEMIGIIAEDIAQFTTPEMIESIMAYCEERGYKIILQNLRFYARWQGEWQEKEEEYYAILNSALQEMLSIKVDGIIYIAGHARVINCFPVDMQVPGVVAYAYAASGRFPSIVINDEKGGYDMTKYLISMGHKKIGVIGGKQDNIHTQKRLRGYQQALFDEQLLYNPEWVRYGDWERESGYEEVKYLVKEGITAIFAFSDKMAGGVYDYLEECGLKIGEDISVVGYDKEFISEYFRPALSTAKLPLFEIGCQAARQIIDLIEKEDGDESFEEGTVIELPCSIVIRDSVKKA